MTLRDSNDPVVPQRPEVQSGSEKPGNTGAGKAVRPDTFVSLCFDPFVSSLFLAQTSGRRSHGFRSESRVSNCSHCQSRGSRAADGQRMDQTRAKRRHGHFAVHLRPEQLKSWRQPRGVIKPVESTVRKNSELLRIPLRCKCPGRTLLPPFAFLHPAQPELPFRFATVDDVRSAATSLSTARTLPTRQVRDDVTASRYGEVQRVGGDVEDGREVFILGKDRERHIRDCPRSHCRSGQFKGIEFSIGRDVWAGRREELSVNFVGKHTKDEIRRIGNDCLSRKACRVNRQK